MEQIILPLIHRDGPPWNIVARYENFDDADKNTLDGVKFTWDDRWVHFRKSNTEPIIRIYAEAPNKAQAADLVASIKALI